MFVSTAILEACWAQLERRPVLGFGNDPMQPAFD